MIVHNNNNYLQTSTIVHHRLVETLGLVWTRWIGTLVYALHFILDNHVKHVRFDTTPTSNEILILAYFENPKNVDLRGRQYQPGIDKAEEINDIFLNMEV